MSIQNAKRKRDGQRELSNEKPWSWATLGPLKASRYVQLLLPGHTGSPLVPLLPFSEANPVLCVTVVIY